MKGQTVHCNYTLVIVSLNASSLLTFITWVFYFLNIFGQHYMVFNS
uniref:Uncharacterized protein n=1 Tax=Rhizophora mucronata TaxID=61149 RepID=A0A2P2QI69_RHIMU